MEVGIREAKAQLSKLIDEVQSGNGVFVTNHGKRVAELVAAPAETAAKENLGFGMFKDKIRIPPGWDTQKARRQATDEVIKLMGIDS